MLSKINLNLFKLIEISENKDDLLNFSCDICSNKIKTVSVFNECKHIACLECLDNLYDNSYKNTEFLFLCLKCNTKVYDISYENK